MKKVIVFALFWWLNAECQTSSMQPQSNTEELQTCDDLKLPISRTVENVVGNVKKHTIETQNGKRDIFLISYNDVPTGNLAPCNLPESFKMDNTQISFSGKIFLIENIDTQNRNSIPLELTAISIKSQR